MNNVTIEYDRLKSGPMSDEFVRILSQCEKTPQFSKVHAHKSSQTENFSNFVDSYMNSKNSKKKDKDTRRKTLVNNLARSCNHSSDSKFDDKTTTNINNMFGQTSLIEEVGAFTLGFLQIFIVKCEFDDLLKKYRCDAVVNPANIELKHKAGLAKAISDRAGKNFNNICFQALQCLPNKKL